MLAPAAAVLLALGAGAGTTAAAAETSYESVLRINVGGGNYTDSKGQLWQADTGFNTGQAYSEAVNVAGTDDPALFAGRRWDARAAPEMKYSLPLTNGDYVVRLYFAETSGTVSAGTRVFDVKVEDKLALDDLDIFARVGANKALLIDLPAKVADGQVDIEFLHRAGNPILNAIELLRPKAEPAPETGGSASVLRINVGGGNYTDSKGQLWQADTGFNTGHAYSEPVNVAGTDDSALFAGRRWDARAAPEMKYSLPLTNGDYVVRLYFAETSGAVSAGTRVFDVKVEDKLALDGLDIFAQVGANKALLIDLPAKVADGQVDIEFLHRAGNPILNAIEVLRSQPESVLRINVGGGNYTDSTGRVWQADTGFNTGQAYSENVTVAGTADSGLYAARRWDAGTLPEMKYSLPVANGDYTVRLYFAETNASVGVGTRVFDVLVEDQLAVDDLDIVARAGANTALLIDLPAKVADGRVDIEFLHQAGNPILNAIEVIRGAGASPQPQPQPEPEPEPEPEVPVDPADVDGDGMLDSWEVTHGLDPSDPADAGKDSDGDGYSNLEEYKAGSSPVDLAETPLVGSVSLTWTAPSSRTDGKPLAMSEIAGYRVHYGTASGKYTSVATVQDAYTTRHALKGLRRDTTYYFAITAFDRAGAESTWSNEAVKSRGW